MRINKFAIASALLSCVATVAVLHYLRNREEGAYWWFREQNDAMRYQAYLRQQAARAPESADNQPAGAPAGLAPQNTNTGDTFGYHNAGLASPSDAMQTFVWACDRADVATLAGMFHMDEQELSQGERFFAALPGEVRTKWRSLNELAAHLMILSSLANSFPPADVLAAAPVEMNGEDRATCGIVHRVTFRRLAGQWKCELSAAQLETLYRDASQTLGAR